MADRIQGTVKFFNSAKGFGFVTPDVENPGNGPSQQKDVFIHVSALKEAGLDGLFDGDRVEFEIVQNKGKSAAGNVRLLDAKAGKAA